MFLVCVHMEIATGLLETAEQTPGPSKNRSWQR